MEVKQWIIEQTTVTWCALPFKQNYLRELSKGSVITKGMYIRRGSPWRHNGRCKMRALEGVLSTVLYVVFLVWWPLSGPERQWLNAVHPCNAIFIALLTILVSWLAFTHSVSYGSTGQRLQFRDLWKELSWCEICILPFVLPKSKWRQDVSVQHLRFPFLLKKDWKDYCKEFDSNVLLFISNFKKENTALTTKI